MSVRLGFSLSLCVLWAFPVTAVADGFGLPGYGAEPGVLRPSYRDADAGFPPPQHDALGQPAEPTGVELRPTYRQTRNDFPPGGGRYGGGFLEYVMTGGRPEPIAPQYAPSVPASGFVDPAAATPSYAPAYAEPAYAAPVYGAAVVAPGARLPQSGLPDYAPQPPAYYGSHPSYSASVAPQPEAYGVPQPAYGAAYDPVARDPGIATRPISPVFYRQMVEYPGRERPGTIVIDTPNKFLYLVQPGRRAIRYGIGVGRPGFSWSGIKTISRKAEWPAWTPPSEMLARRPDLPRHMDGGEANPLGARALYLGSSLYRIHGTNEPYTIGTNVSSGCIRMMNQDVIDLYGRVGVGTRVIVM